jgi:hypothetical protein
MCLAPLQQQGLQQLLQFGHLDKRPLLLLLL